MKVNILIADDHTLFRKGLIAILEKSENINVFGESSNGVDVVNKLVNNSTIDLLLLDLHMPLMDGYAVLDTLKKKKLEINVVVISMLVDDFSITQAIERGAKGYLFKEAEPEEILVAIQSVMENGFYFNEKTNKALLNRLLKKDFIKPVFPSSVVKFSEREIEIIELLIKEYTTAEIGAKLYLSPRTVETIRQNMIHKAGARTVIGLIIFALKRGLVHI